MTIDEDMKALALRLNLPGVTEAISWGAPCPEAYGKMWTCRRPQENAAVFQVPMVERDLLCEAAPDAFFCTPHDKNYPLILMRPERFNTVWARARLLQTRRSMAVTPS